MMSLSIQAKGDLTNSHSASGRLTKFFSEVFGEEILYTAQILTIEEGVIFCTCIVEYHHLTYRKKYMLALFSVFIYGNNYILHRVRTIFIKSYLNDEVFSALGILRGPH